MHKRVSRPQAKLLLIGRRFRRSSEVLGPAPKVQETAPGTELKSASVTTGNLAGIYLINK